MSLYKYVLVVDIKDILKLFQNILIKMWVLLNSSKTYLMTGYGIHN